ncbi:MAG: HAD hydrolase-like protein [Candidatus Paceibacterota bacterium]
MSVKKPLILFDIDGTLIDTLKVVKNHFLNFAKVFKVTPDKVEQVFKSYLSSLDNSTDFSPAGCIAYLAEYHQADANQVESIFYHSDNFGSVLFPESRKVLQKLQAEQYTLGIFSEGFADFQERKLTENNILDFFYPEYRYILRRKMDTKLIESLPENTIIIDDKTTVITFLEKFPNIIPLHIVREVNSPTGEYTLSSLNDLFPILAQLSNS